MKPKLTRNAMKKKNSGSRPVCTICVSNQPDERPLLASRTARFTPLTCSASRLVKLGRRLGQRGAHPVPDLLDGPVVAVRVGEVHELAAVAWIQRLDRGDLDSALGQLRAGRL